MRTCAIRVAMLACLARSRHRRVHTGEELSLHGHAFTADDWTVMLDFFDKHARGKPLDRTFDRFPTEQEPDAALAAASPAQGAAPANK